MLRKLILMPRKDKPKDPVRKCAGGRSFACRRDSHPVAKELFCWRCNTRMGCTTCCQGASDRVCLVCHDGASKTALEVHGAMVKDPKVAVDALKIVGMCNAGQIIDR